MPRSLTSCACSRVRCRTRRSPRCSTEPAKTGRGNGWTRSRVCSLRSNHGIATYRDGERQERGEVTLDEAAAALSVSPSSVRRHVKGAATALQSRSDQMRAKSTFSTRMIRPRLIRDYALTSSNFSFFSTEIERVIDHRSHKDSILGTIFLLGLEDALGIQLQKELRNLSIFSPLPEREVRRRNRVS